ncbi:tumor necrosis factor ligand superfamily member 6 isoform X2 [Hypomesus transpacificus]|uniref:tumor necrosis factor ligand superfamily member 6 isoform X2 n=1 Tax=Hypomesus transpacificus TaxID=137520 RepID=UPI001F0746F8|nr:tumor necrosis factor ligand superfamily member 6 isoform X2 [Hypomesus transpacificus]
MSCSMTTPYPQVFMVDHGRDPPSTVHPPDLVPCWMFPPAQERVRRRGGKEWPCQGALLLAVLFVLLLVFAALGLGALQIHRLQMELATVQQEISTQNGGPVLQKQVGLQEAERPREETDERPAAHVIGYGQAGSKKTLGWEPQTGRAFTKGGVVYRAGELQVNHTGLYQVYSRVEYLIKHCSPTDGLIHTVLLRRPGHSKDLILMQARREGFCRSNGEQQLWSSGSHLGSVHQLQGGDGIYVNVSRPDMISHNHNGNFFGLYKV